MPALDTAKYFMMGQEMARQEELDRLKKDQLMYERERQNKLDAMGAEKWATERRALDLNYAEAKAMADAKAKAEEDINKIGTEGAKTSSVGGALGMPPEMLADIENQNKVRQAQQMSQGAAANVRAADMYKGIAQTQAELEKPVIESKKAKSFLDSIDKELNNPFATPESKSMLSAIRAQVAANPASVDTQFSGLKDALTLHKDERKQAESTDAMLTLGYAIHQDSAPLIQRIASGKDKDREKAVFELINNYPNAKEKLLTEYRKSGKPLTPDTLKYFDALYSKMIDDNINAYKISLDNETKKELAALKAAMKADKVPKDTPGMKVDRESADALLVNSYWPEAFANYKKASGISDDQQAMASMFGGNAEAGQIPANKAAAIIQWSPRGQDFANDRRFINDAISQGATVGEARSQLDKQKKRNARATGIPMAKSH